MQRLLHVDRWWASPLLWLEWFLVANIAFLGVDIYLAHAINAFEHRAEWFPIVFSTAATLLLLLAIAIGGPRPSLPGSEPFRPLRKRFARLLGLLVGWGSIVVGVAGLLYHLNADFFQEQTLKNLVYTAPFVAPLAYAGLGLLIVLDRMVDGRSLEWSRWVILLAAGGCAGNFVLSLADHAQNGFFYPSEWIGVVGGALAFSFLVASVIVPESVSLLAMNLALMAIQVVIGLLGFVLHARADLTHQLAPFWDRLIFGAPIFAPLLFADIALLATLGLWAQARYLAAGGDAPS